MGGTTIAEQETEYQRCMKTVSILKLPYGSKTEVIEAFKLLETFPEAQAIAIIKKAQELLEFTGKQDYALVYPRL
jgi:hypothetical protein